MSLKSIRGRLTVFLLSSVLVLTVMAGIASWSIVRSRIVREFDRFLEAEARGLMVLTAREGEQIEADFDEWRADLYEGEGAGEVAGVDGDADEEDAEEADEEDEDEIEEAHYQLFLADGRVIRKSGSLGESNLPIVIGKEKIIFRNVELPSGEPGRLVQITYRPDEDDPDEDAVTPPEDLADLWDVPKEYQGKPVDLVLVVARDRGHLEELLSSLALTLGGLGILLVGGIGLVVRVALVRGFRPLDTFNEQVQVIGPETLEQRVTIANPPQELEGAVAALNGLLDRVEEGFERERRFSSDVAHELRTPLAEVLTACEVGAKWPDDPEATRHLFEDLKGSALHLRSLVTTLLELSRCDNGTVTVTVSQVPIGPLVEECWQRSAERARAKNMSFVGPADDQTVVDSDPDRLRMIVQNLIDNAITHGDPGSTISCEIARGSVPIVRMSNAASGFTNYDVRHIFDRFWQRDVSRTASDHCGLGLSIVKALCDLLGITVQAEVENEERFVMTLSFPS